MKLKELAPRQIVAVRTYGDSWKLAMVIEVGTYTKTVYGRHEFRGHKATVKGVKVAYERGEGSYPLTKTERKRVFGKPEETYIDPFDGATVIVPATEDTWVEVEVPATEWVRPQDVLMTGEEATKVLEAKREREAGLNRLKEQTNNLHPCVVEVLENAGISEYRAAAHATGGKVELSYSEFMKIVDHLDPEGDRR